MATWPCFSVPPFLRFTILVTPLTTVIKYFTEGTLRRKDLFWHIFLRGDTVHCGEKTWWRDCTVAGHVAAIAGSRET